MYSAKKQELRYPENHLADRFDVNDGVEGSCVCRLTIRDLAIRPASHVSHNRERDGNRIIPVTVAILICHPRSLQCRRHARDNPAASHRVKRRDQRPLRRSGHAG